MTTELAKERNIDVDEEGFKSEMKKHQAISRAEVSKNSKVAWLIHLLKRRVSTQRTICY